MQGPRTHTAMQHAELSLATVWDHFLNMGGCVGHLEVDAYLHGMMALPADDGDCVAQAVNELLDDCARAGRPSCCRAPYARTGAPALQPGCASSAPGARSARDAVTDATAVPDEVTGTGPRGTPRPSPLQPVRRAMRRGR